MGCDPDAVARCLEGRAEGEEGLDVAPASDDLDYDVQPEGGPFLFGARGLVCGFRVVESRKLAVDRCVLGRWRRGSLFFDCGVLLD